MKPIWGVKEFFFDLNILSTLAFKKYSDHSAQTPHREAHHRTHQKRGERGEGGRHHRKVYPSIGDCKEKVKNKIKRLQERRKKDIFHRLTASLKFSHFFWMDYFQICITGGQR